MPENVLPVEPTVDEIATSEVPETAASAGVNPKYRKLFSVAVIGFAIWYFGFRSKKR